MLVAGGGRKRGSPEPLRLNRGGAGELLLSLLRLSPFTNKIKKF